MRLAFLLAITALQAFPATWISTKIGPFLVFSEGNPKQARACAAELEQMRFSLGELLGRRDLTIHPQLQLFLLSASGPGSPLARTRTGAIPLTQNAGPLTLANRKMLTRILLEQNIGRMPPAIESGLETFFSTTSVQGAHVVWGEPPPASEQTPEWALMHWLITNPETYGNVRVFLANLENGVAEDVSYSSAFHQSEEQIVRQARAAPLSATIDAPSRPLSPERDLAIRQLEDNDATLRLADLLNDDSASRYRALLNAGVHKTEAEEGLALLADRRNDLPAASEFLHKAMADGSKNALAMVEYARLEPDPAKARAVLESAVSADPNSAEAHFLLGQKLPDPPQQLEQFRLAAKLAPRNQEYWVTLANALAQQKQWSEAAKAWHSAEQAAPTPAEREKMIAARMAIEEQRLDFEDAEKRKQQEARERETNRLKQQAIAEIREAEAKVNRNASAADTANAVPWDQLDANGPRAQGSMIRVECVGRLIRLVIRQTDGKLLRLSADPRKLTITDAKETHFSCGPQKARDVEVTYDPTPNARTGTQGNARTLEFR